MQIHLNNTASTKKSGYSMIDLDRVSCPSEALKLDKKEMETVPPDDCTSLYKILAERY